MKLNIQLFASSKTITKTIKDSYNNSYTVTATINESIPEDYISTNKTLVSGKVTVSNTGNGGAYTSSKSMSATMSFLAENSSGTTLASATGSCKFDFQGDATKTATPLTYNNLEISHNTDGSRTIYIQLVLKITETSLKQTQTYTDTLVLTTIPRASQPTVSSSSTNMGTQITITTNRASSAFTHKITYQFGSLTNQTSGLGASTNVGTSTTFTPPLSLASQVPSATSGGCIIICTTYNGAVQDDEHKIGTKTVGLTLNVPSSVKPSISIGTLAEADSTMSSLNWGVYVQNKSKLSIPITVTPAYSSPTTSSTTANGSTYTTSAVTSATTTTKTTGVLTTTGTNTISATASDNRSRSGTASKTFSVVAYSEPSITTADVIRVNSSNVESDEGTYISYKFVGSISSVSNKNAKTFRIGYRTKGSTGSYTYKTIVNNAYTVNVTSYTRITDWTFNANTSYEIVFEAIDSFRTSSNPVRISKEISSGFDLMNFNANGKAMAIGKVSEATGTNKLLEIALPMKVTESLSTSIFRESGGNWWKARDNAVVKQTKVTETEGNSWNPVVSVKTATGDWSIGNVGGDRLVFAYVPDTSYSGQTNTNCKYYYLNTSGVFTGTASSATSATTASKTSGTLTVKMNSVSKGTFNGSSSPSIDLVTHPVGSVMITSTNTAPTVGGTWSLIDKEFSSATGTSGYTINSTNCTAVGTFAWARAGHSITLTVNFTNKVQIKDDALTMFTINLATWGITALPNAYYGQTYSDLAKCSAFVNISTAGAFQTVEVIPDNYISAGRTDNRGTFVFIIPKDNMVDSACDKFYWKRTA